MNAIVANRIEPYFSLIRPGPHTSPREYVLLFVVVCLIPVGAFVAARPLLRKEADGTRRFYAMNAASPLFCASHSSCFLAPWERKYTGATSWGYRTAIELTFLRRNLETGEAKHLCGRFVHELRCSFSRRTRRLVGDVRAGLESNPPASIGMTAHPLFPWRVARQRK